MKYHYYVGVLNAENKINFVTRVDNQHKISYWTEGEKAKRFTLSYAKDLVFGLGLNGYNAVVITAPEYYEFKNTEGEGKQ